MVPEAERRNGRKRQNAGDYATDHDKFSRLEWDYQPFEIIIIRKEPVLFGLANKNK